MHSNNHRSVDHYLTIDVGPETSNGTLILTLRRTLTGAGRHITKFQLEDAREVVALYKSTHNARCFCRFAELAHQLKLRGVELDQ